jgi:hypothetical protein
MPCFLKPCASGQGPARRLVSEETQVRGLTARQGSGTQPCRPGSQRRVAAAPSRAGAQHRVAEAPDHSGLCVARAGHGVVQSEARSRSIGITRSGESSGVTVIDLRIRRWVYEQRHCCLVFFNMGSTLFHTGQGHHRNQISK